MDEPALTHLNERGEARMVDVGAKAETRRAATATGTLSTSAEVVAMIAEGRLPKGEALATARIAGIAGTKHTPFLVPLCHPLPITSADVRFELAEDAVLIEATVTTVGRTGVEMEAMTAVSVAALTLYDMVKGVDRGAMIRDIRLISKNGGKSGSWTAS